jgi:hypothetical protein
MDDDNEMMMELLMQDEAPANQEHRLMVLTAIPRQGGLRVGKAKNNNRHRLAGALLLDSDYFADEVANNPTEFGRRFRMNKELFMKIMFGVR